MTSLFKKKYFLEVYLPIGIAISPFIMLLGGLFGLNLKLSVCFGLGMLVAIIGRIIYLATRKTRQT
jgi:ABC-type transport system involved in cytochrome bd biosynthesis fused ATPase/permease subunit